MNNKRKRRILSKLITVQAGCCFYCQRAIFINDSGDVKQRSDTATIDHLLPQAMGGGSTQDNIVAACTACNSRKANMTLHQFVSGALA